MRSTSTQKSILCWNTIFWAQVKHTLTFVNVNLLGSLMTIFVPGKHQQYPLWNDVFNLCMVKLYFYIVVNKLTNTKSLRQPDGCSLLALMCYGWFHTQLIKFDIEYETQKERPLDLWWGWHPMAISINNVMNINVIMSFSDQSFNHYVHT